MIETYCVNKDKPELQCNGKCHLAKQISTDIDSSKDIKGTNSLSESFFPVFHHINEDYVAKNILFLNNKLIRNKNSLRFFSLQNKLEQPPDFLS